MCGRECKDSPPQKRLFFSQAMMSSDVVVSILSCCVVLWRSLFRMTVTGHLTPTMQHTHWFTNAWDFSAKLFCQSPSFGAVNFISFRLFFRSGLFRLRMAASGRNTPLVCSSSQVIVHSCFMKSYHSRQERNRLCLPTVHSIDSYCL